MILRSSGLFPRRLIGYVPFAFALPAFAFLQRCFVQAPADCIIRFGLDACNSEELTRLAGCLLYARLVPGATAEWFTADCMFPRRAGCTSLSLRSA